MENRKRIQYTHYGACANCPKGQEYRSRINLNFFRDIQSVKHIAIALIDRHNTAQHPGQPTRINGIL